MQLEVGETDDVSSAAGAIRAAGYDIADTARWLEEFYLARAAGRKE